MVGPFGRASKNLFSFLAPTRIRNCNMTTNDSVLAQSGQKAITPHWKEVVAKYQHPTLGRALWQISNTLVPYLALWYLLYWSLGISYWLTGGLALLAAGLLVRVFIIFHDCGHG